MKSNPKLSARQVSLLMLSFAVMFNLAASYPLLSAGVNDAGDDQYHLSQAYYLRKLILEDHSIFGVVEAYGTGYPWFNTHQFLMYLLVAAFNILSFNTISLLSTHKILLVLLYCLYPLGVYYALDKYKRPPLLCALAALLSVLPISGWGHTSTSYFVIGLSSQVAGSLLFPFALGSFHEAVTEGRGVRRTALLYVLVSFAHPYYGYFLVFVSALDVLVYAVKTSGRKRNLALKRVFSTALIALLLSLFWLMPLSETLKYAPRNLRMQSVTDSFSVVSALKAFVSGEMFDVSDNFGKPFGKNLRWPINTGRGRLPVLTALTVLGLVYALVKRDRFSIFCLIGFLVAFTLLVGADDVPILKYLPFSKHANAKRTIYLLEFFAICVSAQALHWVLASARRISGKISRSRKTPLLVASLILVGVLYTPYNERLTTAKTEVNTLSYWIPQFTQIRSAIKKDGFDGRMYGDTEVGVKSAPVILSQPWLLDTPYQRRIYSTRFWGDIVNYPNVFHVFNIRYLVTGVNYRIPENIRPLLTELHADNLFRLYRFEGDFGYAFLSLEKPALLSATEDGWRREAEVWLSYYKNDSRRDGVPLIVHLQNQDVVAHDYSLLAKYDQQPPLNVRKAFSDLVFDGTGQPHNIVRESIRESTGQDVVGDVSVLYRSASRFVVRVNSSAHGLLVYKIRYHPYWRVSVDGSERDTLRVTPEYPGVFIAAGMHVVDFEYKPPATQKIANLLSFIVLLFVLSPAGLLSNIGARAKRYFGVKNISSERKTKKGVGGRKKRK